VYGTVMIGRLANATSVEDYRKAVEDWKTHRAPHVPGFLDEWVMIADDGVTVVNVVRFRSRKDYAALADDPAQSEWWAEKAAPLFDGDPQWIDGTWESRLSALPDQLRRPAFQPAAPAG
jgi:hypothetical protein